MKKLSNLCVTDKYVFCIRIENGNIYPVFDIEEWPDSPGNSVNYRIVEYTGWNTTLNDYLLKEYSVQNAITEIAGIEKGIYYVEDSLENYLPGDPIYSMTGSEIQLLLPLLKDGNYIIEQIDDYIFSKM